MRSLAMNDIINSKAMQEMDRCARCGKCQSVCPVFKELKDEAYVARGRVALFEALSRGEITASAELQKIMSACLMCKRCSEVCPSGVEFTNILMAARQQLAKEMGLPRGAAFVFRRILQSRRLFDTAMRAASLFQKLAPGKRKGNLRHLPLFFQGGKWLPPLAKRSALQRYSRQSKNSAAGKRVGIFVGCLTNYAYPDIIDATVALLEKAGFETSVPTAQLCCGTPPLALGDIDAARKLARMNREAFDADECDFIVTVCASCGRTLKSEYSDLLGVTGQAFSAPVLDISEFICEHTDIEFRQAKEKVTYHDPCHLRWGQGIEQEPRKLLERVRRFEEIPDEMYCCGQAGSFHVFYPEIAAMIGRRKVESITGSDALEIATGCPGCILQLNDMMAEAGMGKRAVHTIEVLARSIRKS